MEVARFLPILFGLHSARPEARTSIRHLDCLKPSRRRAFLLDVVPRLAARGEAFVGLLSVDGSVVAAQLCLGKDGVRSLYYSGYRPTLARYSIGMLTTAAILEDAVLRGVHGVEFLRGANRFKSRWGRATRIETDRVLARRPRTVRAREGYARGRKALRKRLHRWRSLLERIASAVLPQI